MTEQIEGYRDSPRELTPAERACNAETMRHILTVRALLLEGIRELVTRADAHDLSKLSDPEVSWFTENTDKLKTMKYGSDEYKATMATGRTAIDHHQQNNRHHPEYYGADGINGMNLFDLIEMLMDWKASGLRSPGGNLTRSIDINEKRFNIDPALVRILKNTVDMINTMGVRARVAVSYPMEQ
jgi:hypothetical protein